MQGILEQYVMIPNEYSKLLIDGVIILLFTKVFMRIKITQLVFAKYLLIIIALMFISYFVNSTDVFLFIIYIRKLFIYILFFYIILYGILTNNELEEISNLIIKLFLLQVVFGFIKLYFYGISEAYLIGTIANRGGAISTVIPMFGIVIFNSRFLIKKEKINLLYILGLIIFGLIGDKRAIAFFGPISIAVVYFIYNLNIKGKKIFEVFRFSKIIYFIIIFSIVIYVFARVNTTLNPDNEIGGRFDLNYLVSYISQYENRTDYDSKTKTTLEGGGRYSAYAYLMTEFTSSIYLKDLVFGIGPGTLERTMFNENSERLYADIGLGYGASMVGSINVFLQIGLVALAFYFLFYFKIFRFIYVHSYYIKNIDYLISLSMIVIFLIDFLFYSPVSYQLSSICLTFFYFLAKSIRTIGVK